MRLDDFYIPTGRVKLQLPAAGYVCREGRGQNGSLTLLHGCAGLGKTMYLAQLAAAQKKPVVYLALCEEDHEGEMLTAHLCRALDVSGAASFAGAEAAAPQLLRQCIRILVEKQCLLLIDCIDAVTSPAARQILEALLEPAAGGDIRAAAAGRHVPQFLVRRILDGTCEELTARELMFTVEETAAHITLRLPRDSALLGTDSGLPHSAIAEALHAYAGGFPAAEAMILTETARGGKELDLPSATERSHLRGFIEYNILGEMPEGMADYVRRTAFLGACPEEICRDVLGERHAGEKLAKLCAEGILVRLELSTEYPAYPPAIRQALAGMLSASERRALAEKAVGWYAENNRFAEAMHLLEDAGDADTAERLLAKYGAKLLENCEFALIGYCAEIIERSRIPSDPAVLGVLAQYYYYNGEYAEMERALNAADSMFGKENRYSASRGLYNGLLKFERNPELYTANICRFTAFLTENGHPLPYLHEQERALLERVLRTSAPENTRPLRMKRFGGFSLAMASVGKELPWRTRKAAEFAAYMLERGGKPIERDRLLGVLWSDSMPDSAVAMLHNIIYSLRRELSAPEFHDFITYKDKCYAMEVTLVYDSDEAIFAACREVSARNIEGLLPHAELFAGYWGKYLAGMDCEWAREAQEYYDRVFTDGCLMLAAHFHAAGAYGKELVYLKNATALDPYSEQITRELIYCYAAQGYPNRAKACYDEYSALIDEELGIEPSKWLKREYLACFSDKRE